MRVINNLIPIRIAGLVDSTVSGCSACVLAITLLSIFSGTSHGQSRTYQYRAPDGSITFSDFPIHDSTSYRQNYSGFTKPASVVNPCRGLSSTQLTQRGNRLDKKFLAAAGRFNLDAALIKAVARAESCFDPQAVSVAGAKGLMQLMPATARELGVQNIHDLDQNLQAGAEYLASMLKRYANDIDLALAAYNAGPGNVDKYSGIPPFRETERYIRSVKAFKAIYSPLPASHSVSLSSH